MRNAALATGKGGHCYDHKPLDTIANRAGAGLARPKNRKAIVRVVSHQGGYLRWEMCGVRSHIHLPTLTAGKAALGAAPFRGWQNQALPNKSTWTHRVTQRSCGAGEGRAVAHSLGEERGAELAPPQPLATC